MIVVTIRHIRAAKICTRGARDWFAAKGFSWSAFLTHGMSADLLDATGDALALRVTKIARKEADDGQR